MPVGIIWSETERDPDRTHIRSHCARIREGRAKRREGPTRVFPRGLGLGDTAQGPEVAHPALHLPRCVWRKPIKRDAEKKRGPIRGGATDSESAAGELTADEVTAACSFLLSLS